MGDKVDPLLDPTGLKNNGGPTATIALQVSSPAVDAVPIAGCPSTDQRGNVRPDSGDSAPSACDVGAFELAEIAAARTTNRIASTSLGPDGKREKLAPGRAMKLRAGAESR